MRRRDENDPIDHVLALCGVRREAVDDVGRTLRGAAQLVRVFGAVRDEVRSRQRREIQMVEVRPGVFAARKPNTGDTIERFGDALGELGNAIGLINGGRHGRRNPRGR